ncbi:hypothetical protein ACFVDH_24485 [Streptomyces sp. NPDC057674]|uniref:hypothetical protein n=1 Tax=Streptomyces sp. NPDC057674 TaxID=3346203 RepID=UPI0036806025
MDVWKYLVENPELVGALVAAFIGSLGGGWIQARGGRAQAAAAQKAAEITAEAQRVAGLWNVRQVQVAEFIRSIREATQSAERHYREGYEPPLRDEVRGAFREAALRKAEVQLVASREVMSAAETVMGCADELMSAVRRNWPYSYAETMLVELLNHEDEAIRDRASTAQRICEEPGTSFRERKDAFLAAGLPARFAGRLAQGSRPPVGEIRRELRGAVDAALLALVEATRLMLRSDDDVPPSVPRQRRWWRRNADVTTLRSA